MTVAARTILVVGGGIAGLTAATALAHRGFAVTLIERKPELSDGGGVGLSLVANALRALATIGIAGACVAAGMPADSLAMCRPDGTPIPDVPLPRIGGPEWPGAVGIRRSTLHALLVDAATRGGVTIRCGTTVAQWEQHASGVAVTFSDGSVALFDLLVGAEGLYSALRGQLMPEVTPRFTGQAVWRAETPRPPQVRRTHLHLGGRHGVVGICPVSEELAYVYIVEAAPNNPRRDPSTLHDRMRRELEGYGGAVASLAATLDRPDKVSYRPLEWVLAPPPWGAGRIVLIGDAVHANPPVLAQGAAMAIEDAVVLAEELASAADDVAGALRRTVARRYPRSAAVVDASCRLARAEVEHQRDLDVGAVMRAATMKLAEPA